MTMTVEVTVLIAVVSLAFNIYQGSTNMKRSQNKEVKDDASQIAVVITKLESIGNGVEEIKKEMSSIKKDAKEDHERIIKIEGKIEFFEEHYKVSVLKTEE
jgi:peptidoglycan hydrolase CwlO-like protein